MRDVTCHFLSCFGKKMETKTRLYSSSSSPPLSGIATSNIRFDESAYLPLFIKSVSLISIIYICERIYTNLISRCFPVSITQVMSGIVIPVSAMFVAISRIYYFNSYLLRISVHSPMTIFRTPGGNKSKTAAWFSLEIMECSGNIRKSSDPK